MAAWSIWCEGYQDNGGGAGAQLLNREPIEAATFDEAIEALMKIDPYHKQYFTKTDTGWTYWGCRVFDSGSDASASFG